MPLADVMVLACVSPCYGVQDKVNMPQDFWYIYQDLQKTSNTPCDPHETDAHNFLLWRTLMWIWMVYEAFHDDNKH